MSGMAADISRNVVAILLVLVIVVSALGTWAFVTAFEPKGSTNYEPSTSAGNVELSIGQTTQQPITGQVSMSINKQEES